MGYLKIYLWRI